MNKSLLLLCVVCFFAAAGCSNPGRQGDAAQPDWILGESEAFARGRFLLGVGEADTLAGAKTRARAEVAAIFNVTIESEARESSRFARELDSSSESWRSEESLQVERELSAQTYQLLEGLEIADVWQDPVSRRYYALATLPRVKTATSLRTQIQQLDAATQKFIDGAAQSDSLVQKIRHASESIALQQQRRALDKQLRVVSVTGQSLDTSWSVEELIADRARLLSQITIAAEAKGQQSRALQQALADALANQGVRVTPDGQYQLVATLDSVALPPRNGWYFHDANLAISLVAASGERLGGYEWHYKASATDSALAQARILADAKNYLDNELVQRMFAILEP